MSGRIPRPRITDVARSAGVSVATVSRVLNKSKPVAPELERRVVSAVAELGYRPNQDARWLSSRRSNVVGILLPAVHNSIFAQFLHSCSVELRERGFDVMVGLTGDDRRTEESLIAAQRQSHVAGTVIITRRPDRRTRFTLSKGGAPVVFAIFPPSQGTSHAVAFDTRGAVRALCAQIGCTRYKKVTVIAAESDLISGSEAAEIFARSGANEPSLVECEGGLDAGHRIGTELLRSDPPDLVCCLSDYTAIGVLRSAYELGVSVPGTTAVTGFGENVYSHTCTPSLTTVRLRSLDLGRIATENIVNRIEGRPTERLQYVGYEVVEGDSCPFCRQETIGND